MSASGKLLSEHAEQHPALSSLKIFSMVIELVTCFSTFSSGKKKMYDVIQETIKYDFPPFVAKIFGYVANPGLIIPAILLMM